MPDTAPVYTLLQQQLAAQATNDHGISLRLNNEDHMT